MLNTNINSFIVVHRITTMTPDDKIKFLLKIENMLNTYSGKRYHFIAGDDWKFSIFLVERYGKEKAIVEDLSIDQMLVYIKRHVVVDLK